MEKNSYQNRRSGEILVEEGVITSQQLEKALAAQREKKEYLCALIVKLGFAQPQEVFRVLARHLGVEYVNLKKEKVDSQAIEKVPAKLALHYKLMPYKFEDNKLVVVLSDPLDINKADDLKTILDVDIKVGLGYEEDILESIQRCYGMGAGIVEEIMARDDVEEKIKGKDS